MTRTKLEAVDDRVQAAVAAVKVKYPKARALVTGYPVMFGDNLQANCVVGSYLFTSLWITPGDAAWLNGVAATLNSQVSKGAAAAGATFVDVAAAFDGHGRCDSSVAWVAGVSMKSLSQASESSFHPTATGQKQGYAASVEQVLQSASALSGQG